MEVKKKQSTIARSSVEVEYRSMAACLSEIIWLLGLFDELGVEGIKPVLLYCDNKAALQIAANPMYHERTKHIEIDCHFTREKIQQGVIRIEYIATGNQIADILTKGLGVQQHEKLIAKLGIKDIYKVPT